MQIYWRSQRGKIDSHPQRKHLAKSSVVCPRSVRCLFRGTQQRHHVYDIWWVRETIYHPSGAAGAGQDTRQGSAKGDDRNLEEEKRLTILYLAVIDAVGWARARVARVASEEISDLPRCSESVARLHSCIVADVLLRARTVLRWMSLLACLVSLYGRKLDKSFGSHGNYDDRSTKPVFLYISACCAEPVLVPDRDKGCWNFQCMKELRTLHTGAVKRVHTRDPRHAHHGCFWTNSIQQYYSMIS